VEKEEKEFRVLLGVNDPYGIVPLFTGFADNKRGVGYFLIDHLLSRRFFALADNVFVVTHLQD